MLYERAGNPTALCPGFWHASGWKGWKGGTRYLILLAVTSSQSLLCAHTACHGVTFTYLSKPFPELSHSSPLFSESMAPRASPLPPSKSRYAHSSMISSAPGVLNVTLVLRTLVQATSSNSMPGWTLSLGSGIVNLRNVQNWKLIFIFSSSFLKTNKNKWKKKAILSRLGSRIW